MMRWIGHQKAPGPVPDQWTVVIMKDSQVKNQLSGNNDHDHCMCSSVFMVYWLPWSLTRVEDRFKEIKSDTKAYLNLLELGVVLEEISSACPCEHALQ